MKKINYGIDAPNVIRNFFILSALLFSIAIFFPKFKIANILFNVFSFGIISGTICLTEALLMLGYAKVGKFRHRDRMLKLVNWSGNEAVLDVGTGLGLLMNGAAKKLNTGKVIGIDIWNKEDLTANTYDHALSNAQIEGVSNKIEIRNQKSEIRTSCIQTFRIIILT